MIFRQDLSTSRTIHDIEQTIVSAVQPHFENGDIVFGTKCSDEYYGDVTLDNHFSGSAKLLGLNAEDINIPYQDEKHYQAARKHAQVYVEDTLEVQMICPYYSRIHKSYTKSLLDHKKYVTITTYDPIYISLNGKKTKIAKRTICLVIPETDHATFMQCLDQYAVGYARKAGKTKEEVIDALESRPLNVKMKVKLRGPAYITGGCANAAFSGRKWLEYNIDIFVEDFAILSDPVEYGRIF